MLRWSYKLCSIAVLAALTSAGTLSLAEDAKKETTEKTEKAKTHEVDVKGLKLNLPEGWKEKAVGPLQAANFEVPAGIEDTDPSELVIFSFPQGAGTLQANIDRYLKQFDAEDRKVKIYEGESAQGKYTLIDLSGSFTKPSFQGKPNPKKPNTRMLAVVLKSEKGGDYFIRLVGPKNTVSEHAQGLRTWIGADVTKEKERKDDAK
jgi:hypothetical protein